jgi:hypothetical protein
VPASGSSLVFTQYTGGAITRFAVVIRKDGSYFAPLPSGDYNVTTASPLTTGRGVEPQTVRVVAGRTRTVDFSIDTGIR